jgi:hypothetical protein
MLHSGTIGFYINLGPPHIPHLQAMNHIMEYSHLAGYIVILWWHGQSQLKLDMFMPDHKNSHIRLWMVAWWGLLTCRRHLFSGQNNVPGIFWTCNSSVEVFLCAAGAFCSAKKDVRGLFRTCNNPVEAFLRAAGAFFPARAVIHKWLWLYLWGEDL